MTGHTQHWQRVDEVEVGQEAWDGWFRERMKERAPLVAAAGAPLEEVHGGRDKVSAPLVVAGRRDGGWESLLPHS